METLLKSDEEYRWLKDVHGVDAFGTALYETRAAIVILQGNEGYPESIALYETDDYRTKPTVYKPNPNGDGSYVKTQVGEGFYDPRHRPATPSADFLTFPD